MNEDNPVFVDKAFLVPMFGTVERHRATRIGAIVVRVTAPLVARLLTIYRYAQSLGECVDGFHCVNVRDKSVCVLKESLFDGQEYLHEDGVRSSDYACVDYVENIVIDSEFIVDDARVYLAVLSDGTCHWSTEYEYGNRTAYTGRIHSSFLDVPYIASKITVSERVADKCREIPNISG